MSEKDMVTVVTERAAKDLLYDLGYKWTTSGLIGVNIKVETPRDDAPTLIDILKSEGYSAHY